MIHPHGEGNVVFAAIMVVMTGNGIVALVDVVVVVVVVTFTVTSGAAARG